MPPSDEYRVDWVTDLEARHPPSRSLATARYGGARVNGSGEWRSSPNLMVFKESDGARSKRQRGAAMGYIGYYAEIDLSLACFAYPVDARGKIVRGDKAASEPGAVRVVCSTKRRADRRVQKLRHLVCEPVKPILESERDSAPAQNLTGHGCLTRMHMVLLLARRLVDENHINIKDIDLRAAGIHGRWEGGLVGTARALERAPWKVDPLEGGVQQPISGAAGSKR